ncbi:MAG: class II fructose-bisphosphate aldolase [Treponema sp.]|jgi:fructose-bisphosphate aldolase class II|nr:class II fructose-bisphosphate aldolase [Treponema sp.]
MALYLMKEILADARKRGYGIGYYNGVNLEMIRAYIRAAEDCKSPIIIGIAEGLMKYADFDWIAPLYLDAARRAKVPVAVHLDHTYNFEVLMRALRAGFGSVMYDGSGLSYEENVKNSAEIAKIAHPMGVGLECELGKVGGFYNDEGIRGKNILTDPALAADFIEKTDADFLAVSIGNTHGVYTAPPAIDLPRLGEIRMNVKIPLVLHGGSGLSDEDFRNCIRGGIVKVNIYTDVITAAINMVRTENSRLNYTDLNMQAEQAMYEETVKKIRIFGSNDKA